MHLVYPSKFCVAIIFDFSCDDCNTQEQEVLLGAIGNKGYAKF